MKFPRRVGILLALLMASVLPTPFLSGVGAFGLDPVAQDSVGEAVPIPLLSAVEVSGPKLVAQDSVGAVGEVVSVPIVLSEAPEGLAGFHLTVNLSDEKVASIVQADLPDIGLVRYDQISTSEALLAAVDLYGRVESGATDVTLATLTIEGFRAGNTLVQINLVKMDDDSGSPVAVTTLDGKLRVNNPPVAAYTYDCSGLTCTFTDSSTDADGSIEAWDWTFGDGGHSKSLNTSHTYSTPGTYPVELMVTDNDGASASHTQSVAINSITDTLHLHDIDGEGVKQQKGAWKALVTTEVYNENERPVAQATVIGSFYQDSNIVGPLMCITNRRGLCTIDSGELPSKKGRTRFEISDVSHSSLSYEPLDNHDSDGYSEGSGIIIGK